MNRIDFIASLTKGLKSVVDCGVDHAYTLISCLNNYGVSFGYGIDVNEGPLECARENIIKNHLEDKTKLILSNGLIDFNDEAEGLTITGMGGSLISEILSVDIDKTRSFKKLILSAHSDSKKLRCFLINNNFRIVDEYMIEDNNKIYEIIVATNEPINRKYDYYDLVFGPILREKKEDIFIKKYTKMLEQTKHALDSATDEVQIARLRMTKAMLEEILK